MLFITVCGMRKLVLTSHSVSYFAFHSVFPQNRKKTIRFLLSRQFSVLWVSKKLCHYLLTRQNKAHPNNNPEKDSQKSTDISCFISKRQTNVRRLLWNLLAERRKGHLWCGSRLSQEDSFQSKNLAGPQKHTLNRTLHKVP